MTTDEAPKPMALRLLQQVSGGSFIRIGALLGLWIEETSAPRSLRNCLHVHRVLNEPSLCLCRGRLARPAGGPAEGAVSGVAKTTTAGFG